MENSWVSLAPRPADLLFPWHAAMHRGVLAARQGQSLMALAGYQEALAIARGLLTSPPIARNGRTDDCVAALVAAVLDLAELAVDMGGCDLAAAHLATAHEQLIRLLADPSVDEALRRAALRHSRQTHAALLAYLGEHGPHPAIARALRAGCLVLSAGVRTLH